MTPTSWTALVFALFLALPLSRQAAGQPVSGGGTGVIVLFGHSHVENWNVKSLAGFRAINRGRGGDHTQDLLDRFDRDVLSDHPRAVVIWAFDNDVMDAPNRDKAAATELAKANLMKLIETSKAHAIEPVLTTEVTILPAGFSQQVADSCYGSLASPRTRSASIAESSNGTPGCGSRFSNVISCSWIVSVPWRICRSVGDPNMRYQMAFT